MQGKKLLQPNTSIGEKGEKRFEEFFARFSRSGQTLTFSELLMFSLDRSIVHNKIGFSTLHRFFEDALLQQQSQDKSGPKEERSIFPGIVQERGVTRQQFNFLLGQLSFFIYHNDKNHLDRLLSEILAEKTVVLKDSTIEVVRNLIYDEINKRLLSNNLFFQLTKAEQVIKTLSQYEYEIRNIFTIYMQENLEIGDIMLTWKEMAVQNKKMNTQALVKFLRDADIIPHLLSIEQFEEIMMKMVPPANNKEHEFFSKGLVVKLYEKEERLLNRVDGDPHFYFHEFQLLLARIAFDLVSKEELKDQKRDPERIIKFVETMMHLRTNENVGFIQLPKLNRRLLQNLQKFTSILMDPLINEYEESQLQVVVSKKDPLNILAQQQSALMNDFQQQLDLPLDVIIKQLEKELPPIPPLPQQTRQQDKWDPEHHKVIGEPPPAPPPDKNKSKTKPKQKQRRKAGEPEPRTVIFEPMNQQKPKTSEEYQQELSDQLNFDQKLLSNVERGAMSEIQVIPVLIQEIIYPPNPPQPVRTFIEAAINAHNEGNFIFSLQNYDNAKKTWVQLEGRDLTDGLELFFEFQKGSVYESAGRDDLAFQSFLNARNFGNKLPLNSPDRALAYSGIGLILYNTEEWEYALRSFLKAREYREKLLGVESVDTASTFNNLGCCMYILNRNQEAYAYFKLSHAVLEQNLGPYHTRTMTAARNLMKCNKNYFDNIPEYKKLWVTYVEDPYAGGGGKKKKKKKKK